jgi:hypothetical protein
MRYSFRLLAAMALADKIDGTFTVLSIEPAR